MDTGFPRSTHARAIAVLLLLTVVAGVFGEMYAPSQIIAADAQTTARNLQDNEVLFRVGFASYLVEALCDVTLSFLFYALLKPVNRDLSLLAAFFGLVSTSLFGVAELFYFSSPLALSGQAYLEAFSLEQQQALAMHSLKLYGYAGSIFMVFYGIATLIRGYLVFRSGFIPKPLGILLMVGGAGFITKNFLLVLVPSLSSPLFLLPMFVAILSLAGWLLLARSSPARITQLARA